MELCEVYFSVWLFINFAFNEDPLQYLGIWAPEGLLVHFYGSEVTTEWQNPTDIPWDSTFTHTEAQDGWSWEGLWRFQQLVRRFPCK